MKKLVLVLTMAVALGVMTSNVFAQPYTPNITNDVYGTAQGAGNIVGVPTPNHDNDKGPDIHDAISLLYIRTGLAVGPYAEGGAPFNTNAKVDQFQWTAGDNTWKDLSTQNNEGTYIFIGLSASNMNTLGVYPTANPASKTDVLGPFTGFGITEGQGVSGDPFTAGISPLAQGTDFGWYLRSENGSTHEWNSQPGFNSDGYDHMMTYELSALAGKSVYIKVGADPEEEYFFNDPYLITWEDLPYANGKLGDEDFDDMMFLVDKVSPNRIPEPASLLLIGTGLFGLIGLRKKQS